MGRRPRVDRTPEEKWQIVQEAMKNGNVSETCRKHGISPSLLYRWRDEAEQGAKAALGERSAAALTASRYVVIPVRLNIVSVANYIPNSGTIGKALINPVGWQ